MGRGWDTEAVGEENPPWNSLHTGSSPPGDPPAHRGPHATTPPPLSAECLLFQKHRVSHEGDPVGTVTPPALLMPCLGRMSPLDSAMEPCEERGDSRIQGGTCSSPVNLPGYRAHLCRQPSSPRGSCGQAPPRIRSSPGQAPSRAGHTGTMYVALVTERPSSPVGQN